MPVNFEECSFRAKEKVCFFSVSEIPQNPYLGFGCVVMFIFRFCLVVCGTALNVYT